MSGATRRILAATVGGVLLVYLIFGFGGYRAFPRQATDPWGPNEVHMGMMTQGSVPDPTAPHVFIGGMKTIKAGVTVTFVNDDIHPHTIVSGKWLPSEAVLAAHDDTGTDLHTHNTGAIPAPDGRFYSEILQPGQQWRYIFATPGVYPYFCSLHPGMEATIAVT